MCLCRLLLLSHSSMTPQKPYARQTRVTANLQPAVAEFVRLEANTDPLITITNVSIAPNYRKMTVFFTTIPENREQDALIFLKRKATDLRTHLKRTMRLKIIPHVEFEVDFHERHRQHVEEILHEDETEHA